MKKLITLILTTFIVMGCAELQTIVDQYATTSPGLTSQEVSMGLKEALRVGSVNAAGILAKPDGFLKDQAVKILLPPEAQEVSKHIKLIPGGDKLVQEVELRLNRAAEDAVTQAAPIFASAITSMTITDAFNILKGEDNAATEYLRRTTSKQLIELFQPKIATSLDKKLVANISTNESWTALTTEYNKVARSMVGQLANMTPINTKLDAYVTQKALDGLFMKVALEEKKIRDNPAARVSNILKKVFGSQDS